MLDRPATAALRRVLIFAYYFPPLGGVGVHRPVKIAKYLREFGYEPVIVTGPAGSAVEWAPADAALADDVPADIEVIRTVAPRSELTRRRHRFQRWLGVWTPFQRWWREEAMRVGRPAAANADVIFATMSPFSTAAAAAAIARDTGKPWVADLQDPWALDEWTVYPSALHRAIDKRRMRRDLREAAAVIMNTAEATRALVSDFPEFSSKRVVTVTQGWDREDFSSPQPRRNDGRFRIVYAGYSHVRRGETHRSRRPLRALLGGTVKGMDILTRSHVFLLEAMERLRTLDPDLAERVELHIAGPAPPDASDDDGSIPVHHHGYLPHDEAVQLMRSADVLFLPMHDLPDGRRTRTVPGKTYEYLASGRPIVAALPDGDARDLVSGQPNVWLCRPRDAGAMAASLSEIAGLDRPPVPDSAFVESFEWRVLTGKLAAIIDDTLGTTPSR